MHSMHVINHQARYGRRGLRASLSLSLAICLAVGGLLVPGQEPAQASCQYPAQVLNLANWKQTLPTGASKKPEEIKQAILGTYAHQVFFRPGADCEGVVFRAPVNGVTTSGSGYPRSELREMAEGGQRLASWETDQGTHAMFIEQAITAVPKTKKHVVAGQIHDGDDDVIVIRLEHPKLFIDINGEDGPVLDPAYSLGKRFTVRFVAQDGKIQVFYNGGAAPAFTLNKKGSGNYFKAGAYTQSNCEKESDCSDQNYGEVVIYKLAVAHSGSTLAELPLPAAPAVETVAYVEPAPAPTPEAAPEAAPEPEQPPVVPSAVPEPASNPGLIAFEAESGSLKAPMLAASAEGAMGGQYLVQQSKKGKGGARYTIQVPEKGRYQLRARVIAPDGSSNSAYYKFGSKSYKKWSFPSDARSWTWISGPTLTLPAGNQTFTVKKRERGLQIDSFELHRVEEHSLLDDVRNWVAAQAPKRLAER